MNLEAIKPKPITYNKELVSYDQALDISLSIKSLEAGNAVLIDRLYSDGMQLIFEITKYLKNKIPNTSFQEQQAYRSEYKRLSSLVLIEIADHQLRVKKAPSIGWLKILYPDSNNFTLTFPQIQGLNSSWQWYQKGISIPVLRNKIHPYYGIYFPSRFDHLILFDNWLKRYEGAKKSVIEVGVGSGVIAFQMIKHGFQKVFATDVNPNAIIGLTEYMGNTKLSRKIELDFASYFGKWDKPTELIVFNPPWLPETKNHEDNDKAIYYDQSLFPEFFKQAQKRLLTDGKLVVLFSNLAQITSSTKGHPIEEELANGGRFLLEKSLTRPVKAASDKTKRDQHWRATEEVELWVLTHKP